MFRNRGSVPNIKTNKSGNNRSNTKRGYRAPHYTNYWNGNFIIIQYDKKFVAMELISSFIILLIIFAVYLFNYKVSFQDPIATIKNNFLNAQLTSIVITIIIAALITFFTKSSKEKLIRNLRIVVIGSILVIVTLLGIKLNMDNKYNETVFEEFYERYEQSNSNNKNSNKISLGLSGVKISSLKEAYIEESVNAYTNFSVKAMIYMVINMSVVIIIFYLSNRLATIETKKERLAKDDAILYDEEENIKF